MRMVWTNMPLCKLAVKTRDKVRDVTRDFLRARGGNVAITFAFATLPVIGMAGAAVDYSHANSVKAAMQAALDSTALMLSKDAPTLGQGELQSKALTYFTALFNRPEAKNIKITASYSTTSGSSLLVNGSATVDTTLLGVMGYKQITVDGSATAKWGSERLRVALVLDNTGSMADAGKISALKTATKNLLNQLQSAASVNGDVYVSIVPFVKDIAVDPSNYKQKWIDWTDWNANNGTCNNFSGWRTPFDQNTCQTLGGTWKKASHKTWNGCITDRGNSNAPSTANYDTNVAAADPKVTASLFPAEQFGSCPQAVMGLSYDWASMATLVNNMSPAGNTNQAIGLAWGWLSLTGGGPFTVPPMDANYTYKQIIILLTDGLNTQNRWYYQQSQIDARQQMTCDNVKAAGITLYTIQVNTDGDPTSTLLQNCASSSDKFFLLTSASDIVTTFASIGTNLTKLRVAK